MPLITFIILSWTFIHKGDAGPAGIQDTGYHGEERVGDGWSVFLK